MRSGGTLSRRLREKEASRIEAEENPFKAGIGPGDRGKGRRKGREEESRWTFNLFDTSLKASRPF